MCYCYILSCEDGTYYTGWTTDLKRRLKEHKRGRGSRYTRSRLPVSLVYAEELPDRSTAMRRERQIKTYAKKRKVKLVRNSQDETQDILEDFHREEVK